MKGKLLLIALTSLASTWMMSCASDDGIANTNSIQDENKLVYMLSEQKPIALTPSQRIFVKDNNKFTLNFLKTIHEASAKGKDFIYSPLSITYVLGMVNDAAEGATRQELEQTLGFHEGGIQAVNEYCKKLIDGLPKVDENVQLNIANTIFVNNRFTLKKNYQDDMQTYYDAKAEALDFSSPNTVNHINDWCNEKTQGMIPSIIENVDPEDVLYLLNAIYFKADWTSKFDPQNTKEEAFYSENPAKVLNTRPMMHQNVLIRYMKNDVFSSVKIPYSNTNWNMTIFLPEEGKTTENVVNWLAENGLPDIDNYFGIGETREVDLKIPRYGSKSDTNDIEGGLKGLLKKMGIERVFDKERAEIPNMCEGKGRLYIQEIRQKAAIEVNEKGSEAAAVTIGKVDTTAMGQEPTFEKAVFHANRPFIYVISESSTNVILFVGKYSC